MKENAQNAASLETVRRSQSRRAGSGNNLVWRQFTFGQLTTSAIRIWVTGALAGYSRITEVEAYTQ
jgi:hypothetical protein